MSGARVERLRLTEGGKGLVPAARALLRDGAGDEQIGILGRLPPAQGKLLQRSGPIE